MSKLWPIYKTSSLVTFLGDLLTQLSWVFTLRDKNHHSNKSLSRFERINSYFINVTTPHDQYRSHKITSMRRICISPWKAGFVYMCSFYVLCPIRSVCWQITPATQKLFPLWGENWAESGRDIWGTCWELLNKTHYTHTAHVDLW